MILACEKISNAKEGMKLDILVRLSGETFNKIYNLTYNSLRALINSLKPSLFYILTDNLPASLSSLL